MADAVADTRIEILGLNWNLDITLDNNQMTNGKDLPWLQDMSAVNVRSAWAPAYRDVVILNPANEQVGVFNLSAHDLALEANRAELKALLLSAAALVDADGDHLSDFWEEAVFGSIHTFGPADDADRDGAVGLLEYAHGSDAGNAASRPVLAAGIAGVDGARHHFITFRRRLGNAGGLTYHVERSDTLASWAGGPAEVVEIARLNPYDGTGTEIVTYRSVRAWSAGTPRGFLRVRCSLP